jgi:4-amino-4-deoxy-L-arabinose transferase-like glycosyltransferase
MLGVRRPSPASLTPLNPATPGLALFLVLLGSYALLHVTLRLALSPVLAIDDAREALFSQTLQLGYLPRQPPLYNWLIWGGVQLLGVSTTTLTLCRYLTLSLAYVFLYLSATLVFEQRIVAMLAAFSPILMGPFTWDAHEELTHTLASVAATAATFYALLRLERSGSILAYLGFGGAIAAGLLAKFSYGLFAGSLLIAALAIPEYRRRILAPRFGLTLGTLLVLCTPYAMWFMAHDLSLARMYAEEVRREAANSYLEGVGRGFYHFGRMLFIFLALFSVVFFAVFWRPWTTAEPGRRRERRLISWLFGAEAGLLVAAILAGSLTYLKFRWLMPAFLLVPFLAFASIDTPAPDRRRLFYYAAALLGAEALVILALTANVLRGDAFGTSTRLNAPYDAVAKALAAEGFVRGTIAAGGGPLAGNLRLRFPDSRVVRLTNPDYLPPQLSSGQCLVVWEEPSDDRAPLLAWVASALKAPVDHEPERMVSARYRHTRELTLRVRYILLPGGRGQCR